MKRIKGFPDYLIAKDGRVFSLKSKKFLKKTLHKRDGYFYYTLFIGNGKNKKVKIHRLIALHYLPNPNNHPCINHIDGNKKNNSIKNLEWCTHSHNNKHAYDIGLKSKERPDIAGVKNFNSKFSERDLLEIRKLLDSGAKVSDIANKFGVNITTIYDIRKGKTYVQ